MKFAEPKFLPHEIGPCCSPRADLHDSVLPFLMGSSNAEMSEEGSVSGSEKTTSESESEVGTFFRDSSFPQVHMCKLSLKGNHMIGSYCYI